MISYEPMFKTMKEKGITSYKLEQMGFPRSTFYSIRRGNSISTNTLDVLCEYLECDVSGIIKHISANEVKRLEGIIKV